VHAYRHENYWRDIGTLESYFDANMDLLSPTRNIEPDNHYWRVHSTDRLSGSSESPLIELGRDPKVNSIIARGARIGNSAVYCSVISPGVVLEDAVDIRRSVLLPGSIIGRGAFVRHAVIDANVVIPAGEKIGYDLDKDRQRFTVQPNGIVVVSQD